MRIGVRLFGVHRVGRRQRPAANDLDSRRFQQLLERVKNQYHVLAPRRFAHQADAPDLALERPQPGADFHVVGLQQRGPDPGLVDAGRHLVAFNCGRRWPAWAANSSPIALNPACSAAAVS